jgi:hypothetical protein
VGCLHRHAADWFPPYAGIHRRPTCVDHALPTQSRSSRHSAALQTASAYLHVAGTQVACVLLGFPPLDPDTAALAEFSTLMLRSAALCEGLLELADDLDRQ